MQQLRPLFDDVVDSIQVYSRDLPPGLFKSGLSGTYACTEGGVNVCQDGCYDCVSDCVLGGGETTSS